MPSLSLSSPSSEGSGRPRTAQSSQVSASVSWQTFGSTGSVSLLSTTVSPSSSVSVSLQTPSPSVSPVASSPVQTSTQSGTKSPSASTRSSPTHWSRESGTESPSLSGGISSARIWLLLVEAKATVGEMTDRAQMIELVGLPASSQVVPPSVVPSRVPEAPTAQPTSASANSMSHSTSVVPLTCAVQVAPPSAEV